MPGPGAHSLLRPKERDQSPGKRPEAFSSSGWGGVKEGGGIIRKSSGKPKQERGHRRLKLRMEMTYNINVALTW